MEAQLIEEQELLEYDCSDGNQVIISAEEVIITECDINTLPHGTEVLRVIHQSEVGLDQGDGAPTEFAEVEIVNEEVTDVGYSCEVSPKSNTCVECGASFKSKKALKVHSTVHVDEADYACEFCSASKIHWTEVHLHQCSNVDNVPIVCPQCFTTVSTKKQLQVHEEVHELQRRFTSKRMDGYFQRKLKEAEDPEIDWGAKPFICGVCGKPFSKLYEVEYHEKLHTGERSSPHKCEKCGLTYLNKHDLNKHTAIGCTGEYSRKTNAPPKRKREHCETQT